MRQALNWFTGCLIVAIVFYLWRNTSVLPPIGHLPGDLSINQSDFHLYLPITSCLAMLVAWEAGNKLMQKLTS